MSKPTTEEATSGHDGFVACICQMHPMLNWGYVSVGEQCGLWTGLLFFFFEAHQQEREYKCWDVE